MKLTRYLLPVILLTVLSTEAFAQDPSAKDAFAAFCKRKAEVYCQNIELWDVRVGKQLQNQLGKYWPVRAKEMYRKKMVGQGGRHVEEVEWEVYEDGFGGYEYK